MNRLRDETGGALLIALFIMILLAFIGGAALMTSTLETKISGNYKAAVEAFYIAEAGIERAKDVLKTMTFDDALDGVDNDKNTTSDNGILSFGSSVSFGGGTYAVRVNDGDGDVWDDSDGKVIITSTGTLAGGGKRTIETLARKANLNDFPAAMTFVDPNVKLEFLSNALSVTGDDKTYDPGPPERVNDGPGPDKNAIATEDMVPDETYSPAAAQNNITGVGGITPDIDKGSTTLNLTDLQAVRSALIAMSGITTYSGSTTITGGALGTRANPQITYVNDSLDLQSNVTGAGILIVDKDLIISGNLVFEGIILVGICPTCPGRVETGTGNSMVFGAVVVVNPTSSHSDEARLKMSGNSDIYYSSFAIHNALNATFSAVSWREVF